MRNEPADLLWSGEDHVGAKPSRAKQLTFDEAQPIAVNIARLPELGRSGIQGTCKEQRTFLAITLLTKSVGSG